VERTGLREEIRDRDLGGTIKKNGFPMDVSGTMRFTRRGGRA